jgi:hypothetical protein
MTSTSFAAAKHSTSPVTARQSTDFLAQIGNTPLIELSNLFELPAASEFTAKPSL